MPTEIAWAKLAAFIDGEGSIYITILKHRDPAVRAMRYNQLVVSVTNTDPRLPLWCRDTFGCGSINKNRGNEKKDRGWKNGLSWRVYSKQAEWVIQNCLPHFVIKREQAEIALAYRKTFKHRGGHDHITATEKEFREAAYLELQRLKHEHPAPAELIQ